MSARLGSRAAFLTFALVLIAVPLLAANEYELRLFMLFLIYGVIAVGLNVLVGLAGLVSLGQAGLFALGAYAGAILATRLNADVLVATLAASAIAAAFGAMLAYPTVRVRGVYLAVITIAFGHIVENVAIEWQSLTGGTTGISSIPSPSLLGQRLTGTGYYAVLALALLGSVAIFANLKASRYGRAMLAAASSETAARAAGLDVTAVRTLAFALASGAAGAAGSLYAFLNAYISPDIFTFQDSVRFLLMVILGGAGTVWGPVVGAFALTYLPEYLQDLQLWQRFAYGALLLAVMVVLPRGVLGTAGAALARWRPAARAVDPALGAPVARLDAGAGGDLVASGLTVRFGGLTALASADLRVRPGEVHALIGPNGAGKSTLINTVTGFYQPVGGDVRLGEARLTGLRPHAIARLGIARTFQNTELFGDMSALDNVLVGGQDRLSYGLAGAVLRLGSFAREEAEARAAAIGLLDFVGLAPYAFARARDLPFGLQRRLEIARALAARPRLLLLDEPAAGLTTGEIDDLEGVIRAVAALGVAVLLVEHHVELIMAVADRVTVLDYGRVIASDRPSVVQDDPRVIEAYFGASRQAPPRAARAEPAP